MKPAPFVRHVPRSLDEALKILADVAGDDGRILAGGQSLVPIMAFRLAKPAHLVDINEVEGLDKIADDGKALVYTYDTQGERTGITALLADVSAAGIRFRDLQTDQSSLEDIFVNLVSERP